MKQEINKESVYLLKYVGRPEVKIGMSKDLNPMKRVQQYNTYSATGVEVLGIIECLNSRITEKKIHQEFNHKRKNGEWFSLTNEDIKYIIDKYSSYEYKKAYEAFLKEYIKKMQNIDEYNLNKETHEGFYEWCCDNIKIDVKCFKYNLLDNYNSFFNTELRTKELFKMINKYVTQNNMKLCEKRTQSYRYIIFELSNPAIMK